MNIRKSPLLVLFTFALASAGSANAQLILGTDFSEPGYDESGNTVGTTASNLPWTSELGQTSSSDLVFGGIASGFYNTGDADGVSLGIIGNVENNLGQNWNTGFSFTATTDILLNDLTITAYAINGAGNHQTAASQSYQFSATLFDGTATISLGTEALLEVPGSGGSTFVLDSASGTLLTSGTTYTISFAAAYDSTTANGGLDGNSGGNNIALGSVKVNAIPEPLSASLLSGLIVALVTTLRRRR